MLAVRCMLCRTAKVMVGSQMKYSNMVKGRQHDQTFDETLEFVLAAGQVLETKIAVCQGCCLGCYVEQCSFLL